MYLLLICCSLGKESVTTDLLIQSLLDLENGVSAPDVSSLPSNAYLGQSDLANRNESVVLPAHIQFNEAGHTCQSVASTLEPTGQTGTAAEEINGCFQTGNDSEVPCSDVTSASQAQPVLVSGLTQV